MIKKIEIVCLVKMVLYLIKMVTVSKKNKKIKQNKIINFVLKIQIINVLAVYRILY